MIIRELVNKIIQGEQNRYGDIEYNFSEEERLESMKLLAEQIQTNLTASEEEIELIHSMIFWSFVDTQNMVDNFLRIFIPLLKNKIISEGFMKHLDSNLTIESRIGHLELVISTENRLHLDLRYWKELVLLKLKEFSEEEKEKIFKSKVIRKFLNEWKCISSFKILINQLLE
jgi:hypothetical protein